jgi:branched-chain amino acid aminotransferase
VTLLASLDGTISSAGEALIPATDDGLLRGDGVFEVVRLYGGKPYALDEHLARMLGSAAALRLPIDVVLLQAEIAALLAEADPGDAALRLVWTRGGHRLALIEQLPSFPATVALRSVTYAPTRVLDGVKSLSYAANMLCGRLAREQGADEALMVTPHGRVLEAPTSSFFLVLEGQLSTPALGDHILDSITRRRVFELTDVVERPVTVEQARNAEEAFLASTFKEVLPVHELDGVELGDAPGPVSANVARLVAERIADELAADRS